MELRQLEYFIVVAEELNYHQASIKVNISQPALSKQINLLENELNVVLFDKELKKKHKKNVLTPEGNYFLKEAKKVVQQVNQLKENLFNYKNKHRLIKLGVFQMVPQKHLLNILKRINLLNNNFEIKIQDYDGYEEVNAALLMDEIDIGISLQYFDDKKFISKPIQKGKLAILMHKNHKLSNNNSLTIRQLKDELWIDFSAQLKKDRNKLEQLFSKEGINRISNIAHIVNSYEMLETLVILKKGIALLPDFVKVDSDELLLVPVDHQSPLSVDMVEVLRYKTSNNSEIIKSILDNY